PGGNARGQRAPWTRTRCDVIALTAHAVVPSPSRDGGNAISGAARRPTTASPRWRELAVCLTLAGQPCPHGAGRYAPHPVALEEGDARKAIRWAASSARATSVTTPSILMPSLKAALGC